MRGGDAISGPALTMQATCPTCSKVANEKLFEKFGDCYYRCPECSFVFVYPRPSAAELLSHYDEYGHEYYSNPTIIELFFAPHKVERELRFLSRVAPRGRLLDVGCSMGAFVKAATARGYEACGIDICAPAIQVGRARGLPVTCTDLSSFHPTGRFDVVTMWLTLEHVPNPNEFMARIHELLRPGGVFLASVPNYGSLTQLILGRKNGYVCRDHLNYWTVRGFQSYFRQHGFDPIDTATIGFNPIAMLRDLRGRAGPIHCAEMVCEQGTSHWLKSYLFVRLALRAAEATLDLFRVGDTVALAGRRQGQPDRKAREDAS